MGESGSRICVSNLILRQHVTNVIEDSKVLPTDFNLNQILSELENIYKFKDFVCAAK